MTKVFCKRLLLPLGIAALVAFFCQPLYMSGGVCDYRLLLLLVGIPFGISKMMVWIVPTGHGLAAMVGILAFNVLVGGVIGIFVLAFRLVSGIVYLLWAAVRCLGRCIRKVG